VTDSKGSWLDSLIVSAGSAGTASELGLGSEFGMRRRG
jgi:hypothetical protein